MMNIVLYDEPAIRASLLPFTFTRPVAGIRIGILTIAEKWQKWFDAQTAFQTEDYLSAKYPTTTTSDNLFINGALCPNAPLKEAIEALSIGEVLKQDGMTLAARTSEDTLGGISSTTTIEYTEAITMVNNPWEIFKYNAAEIKVDYQLLTKGRTSQGISDPHTIVYGAENIFVEEGATIRAAVLNAENGPIYIGKNAQIHEGAIIKGSFALCEGAHVNIGAKIRGDTTVGPFSKVGGEVSNSVIFRNSNKGHEGYLGNSVIGEWCNVGADTNTSNLKNNYADVKIWNYEKGGFKNTGEVFCGLMMGDHAKCGINTMFNTGTVVGVAANIFGSGFPRNFIPSFSWGGAAGFTTFQMRKVYEVAQKVMERRGMNLDEQEKSILAHIFASTAAYRVWEKKDN
jgi:UDP-N-acetylglucosamine diphosphorylase/glucosamine-1-phosphate N-acetyltransferase